MFPEDTPFTANKVTLEARPSIAAINKLTAAEANAILTALNTLGDWITWGPYHGLDREATPAVSSEGQTRVRSNYGTLELSDDTGAYRPIHSQFTAGMVIPRRANTWQIVGQREARLIDSVGITTANRLVCFPYMVARPTRLKYLAHISSTGNTCEFGFGVYANAYAAGDDYPGALLASGTRHSTASEIAFVTLNYDLAPHTLYWLGGLCTIAQNCFIRQEYATDSSLGLSIPGYAGSYAPYTHLYADGVSYNLPDPAPAMTAAAGDVAALLAMEEIV